MARKSISKEKRITLVTDNGLKQEFAISHAERILDMGSATNGGWKIPEDSDYIYDEENGIRIKPNKGDTAKA